MGSQCSCHPLAQVNMHNAVVIAKAEQLSNTCKQLSKNAESNEVQAAKLAHRNKVFKDIANLIATLEEA